MNHERPRPSEINTRQRAFREGLKVAAHLPLFRNETRIASESGYNRMYEMLSNEKGVIFIQSHFAQPDPAWVMSELSGKKGFRGIEMSGPIARHQSRPAIEWIAKAAGATVTSVTTPETVKRARIDSEKSGKPVNFTRKQGFEEYVNQSGKTLESGGVVVIAPRGTRNSVLKKDRDGIGVTSSLIQGLSDKRITDFGIHFVAPEIEGTTDYSKKRGFNLFRKHGIIHGMTYTREEFLRLAANFDPETGESSYSEEFENATPDQQLEISSGKIEYIVYQELARIVPEAYLPSQ